MGTQTEPSLLDDLNAAFDASDEVTESAIEESEDATSETAEAAEVAEEPELPPLEAPNTWKKEYQEKFGSIPREMAEYIRQREEEASRGFTQKGQEIAQFRQQLEGYQQTIQPIADQWVRQGINPNDGLKSLVSWFQAIQSDPKTTLLELAKINNVDLRAELEDQPYVDPQIAQIQKQYEQKFAQLEQQVSGFTSQQQQAKQHAALEQIKAFESATDESGQPKHPHLSDVMDDMVFLLQNGRAKDLDSAYKMAVRLSDSVQQQTAQQNATQIAQTKSQQAQKAKAAANASVSSKETVVKDDSDLDLMSALSKTWDAATA